MSKIDFIMDNGMLRACDDDVDYATPDGSNDLDPDTGDYTYTQSQESEDE